VKTLFDQARANKPSTIFIELDTFATAANKEFLSQLRGKWYIHE